MTRVVRAVCVALGALAVAYGLWLLFDLGWANTRATAVWLVGGVVLHDGVFAVLVMALALVALRLVPRERLAPWVVALVIIVPVTLVGVPELGRFGARADNPTLLDRPYWLGWSVLVTLVLLGAAVGSAVTGRRPRVGKVEAAGPVDAGERGDDGQGAGGR